MGSVQRHLEPVEIEKVAVMGVDALATEARRAWTAEQVSEERLALGAGGAPCRAKSLGRNERCRDRSRAIGSLARRVSPPGIPARK